MPQDVIEVTQREVEIIEVIERGPAGPTGPQPDINYEVVSSARTLEAADLIAADTSGGAFTLTLPLNPSNGDAVDIFDFSETFDTNNLTIARNGSKIESLTEDLICNVEGAYFTLIYTGATRGWQVLPRYGTSGGGGENALTTQGDMLYRGVAVNTRLPIGTAGQALRVNSTATAPEWDTLTATDVGAASTTHASTHVDGGSDSIQPFAGVRFDTVAPDATPSVGQMVWNDTDGTVDMVLKGGNVNMQIGQSAIHRVYNDSGTTIAKGKVVYIFGSQGQRTTIRLADNASDATSARTFGFTAESIADGASGFVISEGVLTNVSTSGLADGTILWLGTSGNYVGTRPTQPAHGVFLGAVVKGNSVGAGSIFVKVQNGQEIDELHDVLITSATAGQVLARNTGNTLWVNKTLAAADVGLGNVANTAQVTSVTGTAPISSSGGTTPAISISAATTSAAGSMSSADKIKLDGIAAGAEVNVNADWNASSGDAQILNKPTSLTPTAHASSHAAGIKASYNDQVAGMTANVFIRAVNVGTAGNSITLTFDGVDDIDTVLAAWNAANTSNTAELVSGDGTQVPDNLEEITLSGGITQGSDPITDPVFDSVGVGNAPNGSARKFHQHGGKFTVESSNGGYGQFQVVNPIAGEVTFVMASDAATLSDGTISSQEAEGTWAFGLGPYGNSSTDFCIGNNQASNAVFIIKPNGKVGLGSGNADPAEALDVGGNIAMRDVTNDFSATFVADDKLSDNRTYDLPDASGTLALTTTAPASHAHGNINSSGQVGSTSGLPLVTTTAGAVTTLALGTANQVLRVNSGATGVEFADPSGGGVTGAAASASDVLGVSGANITGVDANADRIVYWNNTSNKLAYGTPADAGAAAASHTHAASDITSGTIDTARLASGTANSGTFLRGDQTWAAVSGVTTGSVDNAILRADGTGGSTSQSSDINIEDATTSTQNNVAITNQHSGQTNSSLVLGVKGTGAFIVSPARPDGAATGGNARGASAICIQTGARSAAANVASALESIAIGKNTKVTGSYGIAIGSGSYAPSTAICIGYGGGVDANEGTAIGDRAYAQLQGVSVGYLAGFNAYANNAVCVGSAANTGAVSAVAIGNAATGSLRSGFFTRPFNAIYWSGQTTNNTATVLNLDGTATNRFTIAASTALAVDILLVARRATTQDKWLVARRFLGIRRDGSNNTALIGTVQTLGTDQSDGSPTWSFALTADDTNEALQLEVTGATGETVEWRATAFYRVA